MEIRLVEIARCADCPDFAEEMFTWGGESRHCDKLDKEISVTDRKSKFPKWCPLLIKGDLNG